MKRLEIIGLGMLMSVFWVGTMNAQGLGGRRAPQKVEKPVPYEKKSFKGGMNPYLPLWEHLPDGEPRVFEDPDNPGKYRIYIIGSNDLRLTSY